MPQEEAELPSGTRATDILTVTHFAKIFPLDAVTQTLDSLGCGTIRFRGIPNERVVYLLMMLALFRECSQLAVYRTVAAALNALEGRSMPIPTTSAITKSFDRLEPAVFQQLFDQHAVPLGKPGAPGIWFRGRRKMSIDGFTLNTADTKANRKFFDAPSNQHGTEALPQTRCVCLLETGSHLMVKARIGTYRQGEITLATELLPFIQSDEIVLMDRNFYSFKFFKGISERGAASVFRLQKRMVLNSEKQLPDGSHMVTIYDSDDKKKEHGLPARMIQYVVLGARKGTPETIYLLTNILDPGEASAHELGVLYKERWEHENALDELKTHLNLGAVTLRSKSPERVIQELWGMLMAYYAIRSLIYEAAVLARVDSDSLSFTHVVNVVKDAVTMQRNAECQNCGHKNHIPKKSVIREILDERLPPRRARNQARCVRRREKYETKKSARKREKAPDYRVKVRKTWSYRTRVKS